MFPAKQYETLPALGQYSGWALEVTSLPRLNGKMKMLDQGALGYLQKGHEELTVVLLEVIGGCWGTMEHIHSGIN